MITNGIFRVIKKAPTESIWAGQMFTSYCELNPEQAQWFYQKTFSDLTARDAYTATVDGEWCYVDDVGGTSKEYAWDNNIQDWVDSGINGKDKPMGITARDEFIQRLLPGEYLHDTFGPDGQDKEVCDFVYLLYTNGNVSTQGNTKSGDTLRWDKDGNVLEQNDLPTYIIGSNDGIITVSSTDGWNGITGWRVRNNNFSANIPNFHFPNHGSRIDMYNSKFTGKMSKFNLPNVINFYIYENNWSGLLPAHEFFNKLERYWVHRNKFTLFNPDLKLPAVRQLYAYTNKIGGIIPPEYSKFTTIRIFRFEDNQSVSPLDPLDPDDFLIACWNDRKDFIYTSNIELRINQDDTGNNQEPSPAGTTAEDAWNQYKIDDIMTPKAAIYGLTEDPDEDGDFQTWTIVYDCTG